jgi:hypothetical protein
VSQAATVPPGSHTAVIVMTNENTLKPVDYTLQNADPFGGAFGYLPVGDGEVYDVHWTNVSAVMAWGTGRYIWGRMGSYRSGPVEPSESSSFALGPVHVADDGLVVVEGGDHLDHAGTGLPVYEVYDADEFGDAIVRHPRAVGEVWGVGVKGVTGTFVPTGVRYQLAASWAESPVFAAGAYGTAAREMVA